MTRPRTVLLIEDDPDYRRLVARWLRSDYAVRSETRLDDTWHAMGGCDLLLLDLGLPDARGMDTLVAARELARDVPIVVLTGLDADEALQRRALEAGADAFLPKQEAGPSSLRRAMDAAWARHGAGEGGWLPT